MKITKNLLKQLILEIVKHYKDDPRFPITVDRPKLKNPLGQDEESNKTFLKIFKPLISFSYNLPDLSNRKTIVDMRSLNANQRLQMILESINFRRNKNNKSNITTSEWVNKDFGTSFSPEEIKNIADTIKNHNTLQDPNKIISIYFQLGGSKEEKYVASATPEEESGPKTVNIKRPGVFEQKNKKTKVKYKCN